MRIHSLEERGVRRKDNPSSKAILAVTLAAAALAGCDHGAPAAAGGGFAFPPAKVTVAPVVQRDVPVYLEEIGRCVAREVVSIQPQVGGQIVDVQFVDGADVKKGAKLFTIDPRPYQARLEQAEAALAEGRALLALRKLDFERVKDLRGTKAISVEDVDARQNAVTVAEAKVQSGLSDVTMAKLNLEWTSVVAPIDGRAGRRLVDVGNIVNPSDKGALLVLERVDPIYAEFTVPESDLPRVRRSMNEGRVKCQVRLPDATAEREGDLAFLDNAVQEGTGTVRLRASIPNPDLLFWPGQFIRVRLVLGVHKDGLLVPSRATQVGQQGPFVYVMKADSTVELRPIEPSQAQGDLVLVTKGLNPGESVIETGQTMLYPGAKVDASVPAEKKP